MDYTVCTTWLRLFLHEPNKNCDQSLNKPTIKKTTKTKDVCEFSGFFQWTSSYKPTIKKNYKSQRCQWVHWILPMAKQFYKPTIKKNYKGHILYNTYLYYYVAKTIWTYESSISEFLYLFKTSINNCWYTVSWLTHQNYSYPKHFISVNETILCYF
jgi:hypothetical protein